MKPLQIGLLVAAGALGGALLMKWQSSTHREAAPAAAPAVATRSAGPGASAESAAPPEPQPSAEPALPSPFPEKNREARPKPEPKQQPKSRPERTVVAKVDAPPKIDDTLPPATSSAPPAPSAPAATVETSPPRTAPAPVQEPAREPAPPPKPPEPNRVTIAAGAVIPVRLVEGLSSDRSLPGDTFNATLDAPLIAGGFAIAERGARIDGKVVSSEKAGKVQGLAKLEIALTGITTSDGQHVRIETHSFTKTGPTSHGEDAAKVGGGAALGAIIGAIAGGGKGAGIGAAAGGAAGAAGVLLTRGKPATLASETRINFRLREPVTITERQ
jgi:hypothetical protein